MDRDRLSEHFRLLEFATRDGSAMPPRHQTQLRNLCRDYLEPLREHFGAVTVNSGFRSANDNDRVGGAPSSYHTRRPRRSGAAADVSCERGTPAEWHRFLDRLGAPGLGLYDTFVHVDNRKGRARW